MQANLLIFLLSYTSFYLAFFLFIPSCYSIYMQDGMFYAFLLPSLFFLGLGLYLKRYQLGLRERVYLKEGAFFAFFIWFFVAFAVLLPYAISGELSFFDAFCEAISGITTTGLTLLSPNAPKVFIFFRSFSEWFGALITLILLVTFLPIVSSSYPLLLNLPKNRTFSHSLVAMKKMANLTATIYIICTLLGFFIYHVTGLAFFDALNMSFVTLSSGGCYALRAGESFDRPLFEVASIFLMLLASGNFFLYGQAFLRRDVKLILKNTEMRALAFIFLLFGTLLSLDFFWVGENDLFSSVRSGFFGVSSFLSTTGFFTERFAKASEEARFILLMLLFIGGSIVSPAGGFKIVRVIILLKSAMIEFKRIFHPHIIVKISLGESILPSLIVQRVFILFFLYIAVLFFFILLISLEGFTPIKSIYIAAACLSNIGPAALLAGDVGLFSDISPLVRFFCAILMILGRIEIFSFLVVMKLALSKKEHRW